MHLRIGATLSANHEKWRNAPNSPRKTVDFWFADLAFGGRGQPRNDWSACQTPHAITEGRWLILVPKLCLGTHFPEAPLRTQSGRLTVSRPARVARAGMSDAAS